MKPTSVLTLEQRNFFQSDNVQKDAMNGKKRTRTHVHHHYHYYDKDLDHLMTDKQLEDWYKQQNMPRFPFDQDSVDRLIKKKEYLRENPGWTKLRFDSRLKPDK